jgi:TetR/AcrR family transcriptional regulator, transcriptional repressor of bet genes
MARTADRPAQEALLSHAVWDVLAHQGLERLTIRAVATAAGCTTGLVMHRFPNRRALLLHARRLLHERTRARVEALEASSATPREALRAVLRQGLSLDDELRTESTIWIGFLAAAVADEELIAQHRANNQAWRQRITRLVAAAAPEWPAERAAAVASTLIALVEGAAALGSGDPAGYPATAQERMLDDTLNAYGLD